MPPSADPVPAAPGPAGPAPPRVPLATLFGVFFRMGMASFGGGLPGWMHREVVERRGWMSEERFLAGVAIGQIVPGGNSVNLALYIGQQLRGGMGLAVAGFGVLFPPFVMILILAALYRGVAGFGTAQFVLGGLAAAGVGMTLVIGVKSARRLRGAAPVAVAAATFAAVGLLQWPMLPVVLALAPLSVALAWRRDARARKDAADA